MDDLAALGSCESCAWWSPDADTPRRTSLVRVGRCVLTRPAEYTEQEDSCEMWRLDELYEDELMEAE